MAGFTQALKLVSWLTFGSRGSRCSLHCAYALWTESVRLCARQRPLFTVALLPRDTYIDVTRRERVARRRAPPPAARVAAQFLSWRVRDAPRRSRGATPREPREATSEPFVHPLLHVLALFYSFLHLSNPVVPCSPW